jgi:amino acid permease
MIKPLSRQELLGGGLSGRSTKQAATLLTLIENRATYLNSESQATAALSTPVMTQRARAASYLTALAQGRHRRNQPTIHDLERYAAQWADLVPDNPTSRATLAHLLGEKYRFTAKVAKGIRHALALDSAETAAAYQQLYRQPLAVIYAPRLTVREGVQWQWAGIAGWLENLSPFWTAFALTLTETVGAGVLALPIALAGVGPLAGVLFLLLFGILNILTLASVVEAITRNAHMRYGMSYFGRLISDYLGTPAMIAFGIALVAISLLFLSAYTIGIATTLGAATGVPKVIWAVLLLVIILYILRRQALGATVASALVIGFTNIGLICLLALFVLPHVTQANLTYVRLPFLNGQPFDPSLLGLIFGTVLGAYFGHTSVGNMAKNVLRRDPSGRTLLWGNVTAMTVAMVLYCAWILTINGALAPRLLAQTSGTVLIPLATVIGPIAYIIGSIFVLLGMGMASLHMSLGIFNQMQELLPAPSSTGPNWRARLLNQGGRSWLATTPIIGLFLLVIWLLSTDRESFTKPLNFIGAIAVPLVAGIFPMLLLAASRRMGDYVPAVHWRWLGRHWVVGGISLIFFAGLLVHGLFIWRDPLQRGVALVTSAAILLLLVQLLWRGKRQQRTVIELRVLPGAEQKGYLQIVEQGTPLAVAVAAHSQHKVVKWQGSTGDVANIKQLQTLTIELPSTTAQALKVWPHAITPEGDSIPIPAQITMQERGQPIAVPLSPLDDSGAFFGPRSGAACQVVIRLQPLHS